MKNGRCRLHGGHSTGPRTEAGIARIRAARTTHGYRDQESRDYRHDIASLAAQANLWIEIASARRRRPDAAARRIEHALAACARFTGSQQHGAHSERTATRATGCPPNYRRPGLHAPPRPAESVR